MLLLWQSRFRNMENLKAFAESLQAFAIRCPLLSDREREFALAALERLSACIDAEDSTLDHPELS